MEIAGTIQAADPSSALRYGEASDALTGLSSREVLDSPAHALAGANWSVILIDLDQFKAINDTYGHANGDRVLREVGRRLRLAAGSHLPVRLSSDEFAVVVSSADRTACEDLAASVYAAIREPLELDGSTLYLDAGIGIALAHGELTLWELVSRAGASIRPLKRRGRLPRIVVYEDAHHREILETLALSLDLRAALARDQLVLHYQPLVDMASRRALGFEALLRWEHPTRGLIAPLRFVPLAEDAGLMSELGEWVLTQACVQARAWETRGGAGGGGEAPYVSANISIQQLEDPGFIDRFERALATSGLDPVRLKVEITESMLANGVSAVKPQLEAVRAMGVGVLLDDFGTGYSSLGYIRELPLDGVKLDRVFTRDLTVSAGAWALARAIVTMIGQLGLEMVAEGLETAAHLAQLRSLGCHVGQGFYFAKPMQADSLQFDQLGRTST
ncbi:MAG TPA: bifunctional diguanylate cyclase/phosphodiesterase [Solirubrobacteraceae bacterium]|jgi:diguanylate cyclase (GGDEF)-like protein|nr:bifunctional diguanylate cyclase/phosphodiesterase [Solirubrobacteraceae bacterium]